MKRKILGIILVVLGLVLVIQKFSITGNVVGSSVKGFNILDYLGFLLIILGSIVIFSLRLEETLLGTNIGDKLNGVDLSGAAEDPVIQASKDYIKWCRSNDIRYHQSKVHSFEDAVNHAKVFSIPGRDYNEKYKAAFLGFLVHLYDDQVDGQRDICEKLSDFENIDDVKEKIGRKARKTIEKIESMGNDSYIMGQIQKTIMGLTYGALIQNSSNRDEQKRFADQYKEWVISNTEDVRVKKDLRKLHPMQIWLGTSVVLDGFVGLEGGKGDSGLSQMLNVWGGPMIYLHDSKEEIEEEGVNVFYGANLTQDGVLREDALIEMIDLSERNLERLDDPRRNLRLKQMRAVYESSKGTMPEGLRDRYEKSLGNLERKYLAA